MVDENLITLCYRSLDRVVCLCQQPQLNLKNSPPYILDTIPDLYEKLQSILTNYQASLDQLGQIDYFQIFVKSLIERCRLTIRLFKDAKDKLFDPSSTARSRLVKLSLIFSHLLKDLNALFPENSFDLANYRITKFDAAKWWSSHFAGQSIVPWTLFFQLMCQTFPGLSNRYNLRLKQTVDLTCNEYVSIFEFDVFTRLFQPWANIVETWEALTIHHPGYMSFMTYDEVKAILKKFRQDPGPGTYVFRISCTKPGQWAIGYITEDLRILQTIIQNKSLAQALLDGEREGFYLFPNGKPSPRTLLYQLVQNQTLVRLQVTQEQYQTYCEVGSTFELCKICDENNKDIQLEPCRHLICRNCFLNCQLTGNGQTCPFCRLEIKGIEEVVVDPYTPRLGISADSCQFVRSLPSPSATALSSSSSLYRQVSLPDPKLGSVDQDLNVANRSLSVDMTVTCSQNSMPKDLIDLSSDCPDKKPPPVPPRHSSGSPPILIGMAAQNCVNPVKCQSDPSMDPLAKGSIVQLESTSCSSLCRAAQHMLLDRCRCTNLTNPLLEEPPNIPPPALPPSTLDQPCQNNLPWTSQPDDSDPIQRKPDLHYAQLDLVDSDSEMEPAEPDLVILPSRSASDRHSSTLPPAPAPRPRPRSVPNPNPDPPSASPTPHLAQTQPSHYDQLNQQTCRSNLCKLCQSLIRNHSASSNSLLTLPSCSSNSVEHNINHLVQSHPDMTRRYALLLLRLTENRLDMSHRIWEHFQPRTD